MGWGVVLVEGGVLWVVTVDEVVIEDVLFGAVEEVTDNARHRYKVIAAMTGWAGWMSYDQYII